MPDMNSWYATLEAHASSGLQAAIVFLPRVLGAALVLALGWLIARTLRGMLLRFGTVLTARLARRASGAGVRQDPLLPAMLRLFGTVLFWTVFFFFLLAAVNLIQLDAVSAWLDRLAGFAPTLLIGLIVIVAGYLVSVMARDVVRDALASTHGAHGALLSRLAQAAIFLTAMIIGVAQFGVDLSFLTTVLSVALGALLLSFAIAFGLGARELVADLIALRSIQQTYELGQHVRVGRHEGRLIELGHRVVCIDTAEGRVQMPASRFAASLVVVLTPDDGPDAGDDEPDPTPPPGADDGR